MTWLQRYRLRHYWDNSIWILPLLGALAAIGIVRLLYGLEHDAELVSPVDADTARAVLGTLASTLFSSIVFICSALLVAVQLASAALTPRIIGVVFRDPVTKLVTTVLVFAFTLALAALIRIKSTVPLLTAHFAAYASLVSLAVFFYLIDHLGKVLRPSGALKAVARQGRRVIERVYPQLFGERRVDAAAEVARALDGKASATILSSKTGVVLAFDEKGLVSLARRADCILEMVPQVGDYVADGAPLFRTYPGGARIPAEVLHNSVAVGQERTLEQDPTFALRIMVDIASKALSPAINDPTTAVLALDQIHHLLHTVGVRDLDTGQVRDAAGRLRLVYRTPDWEDFVHLAVTEIRHFGGESIQIARRLRAMLENLIQTLPPSRTALLREEITLLKRSAQRVFSDPEDQALAEVSDFQGVGGGREPKQRPSDIHAPPNSAVPVPLEGPSRG
jgi:uncharacterized membrane protein